MQLFSLKAPEPEVEEELSSGLTPSRRQKKFPSDAAPKRKSRKDTPKVWGKKERLWVAGVLLFTILTSAILGLLARDWKLPGLPRLNTVKLPKLSLEKTFVLEGNRPQKNFSPVIADYKSATNKLSGVYGLYVYELNSELAFGVNDDETYTAASLIKMPVLITLYQEAERGSLDLDEEYVLKEGDKIGGAGSLSSKPAGTAFAYRDLARLMGKQSDNTAYGIIKKKLGEELIQETISQIGLSKTDLEENLTSPRDMGILFTKLYQGELVSAKHKNEILEYLTDTIYEEWLAAGVPQSIKVSHKYGREIHVVNDAGIVLATQPYVIVIMTKGVVEREADEIFPLLSKIIYDFEITP